RHDQPGGPAPPPSVPVVGGAGGGPAGGGGASGPRGASGAAGSAGVGAGPPAGPAITAPPLPVPTIGSPRSAFSSKNRTAAASALSGPTIRRRIRSPIAKPTNESEMLFVSAWITAPTMTWIRNRTTITPNTPHP